MREVNEPEEQKSLETLITEQNETIMALFVQVSRLYDLLASQIAPKADANGESIEAEILQGHEEGYLFGPPPSLKGFTSIGEDREEEV